MAKRKEFFKVEKHLTKIEHTKDEKGRAIISIDNIPPAETAVNFPKSGTITNRQRFDFNRWYGIGIDIIVYAFQRQIERFLDTHDGDRSPNSVICYCESGVTQFLTFCSLLSKTENRELKLCDINRDLIDDFLKYLKNDTAINSQRTRYKNTKAVLIALGRRGLIQIVPRGDDATFPTNPFPQSNRKHKGEKPLLKSERKAFTQAVKTALMPLFHEDVELTGELLGYALFVIALYTGRNTTPLLELTIDCLHPHPKENVKLLVVNKRRGSTPQRVPVRERKSIQSTSTVWTGIIRLIEKVIEKTFALRSKAPDHLKDRLWIYQAKKSGRNTHKGDVLSLNNSTLSLAIAKLITKYDLKGANGARLRINISILRQTFANRMFEILDGDLVATASATGNTPSVAGNHYVKPSENAEKQWKFMGTAMHKELLTGTLGASEKTPTGRCSDNKKGQFAPKNGAKCINFLDCIRCRNYVVTGEDLHRLFSFYWLIVRERQRVDKRKWKRKYAHIVRLIDRDVIEKGLHMKIFQLKQVDDAREWALANPHPFWANADTLEAFQ